MDMRAILLHRSIVKYFENINYNFEQDDRKLTVEFGVKGNDLPMKTRFSVDYDGHKVLCSVTFLDNVNKDKLLKILYVLNLINSKNESGYFTYDEGNNNLLFRYVHCINKAYIENSIMDKIFHLLISEVDMINEQLYLFNNGEKSFEEIIDFINENYWYD